MHGMFPRIRTEGICSLPVARFTDIVLRYVWNIVVRGGCASLVPSLDANRSWVESLCVHLLACRSWRYMYEMLLSGRQLATDLRVWWAYNERRRFASAVITGPFTRRQQSTEERHRGSSLTSYSGTRRQLVGNGRDWSNMCGYGLFRPYT